MAVRGKIDRAPVDITIKYMALYLRIKNCKDLAQHCVFIPLFTKKRASFKRNMIIFNGYYSFHIFTKNCVGFRQNMAISRTMLSFAYAN